MIISRKSMMIFGLAMSAALVLNCASKKPSKGQANSVGSSTEKLDQTEQIAEDAEAAANKPNNKVEQLSSSIGILNFRQVQHTLSALTGVVLNAPAATGGTAPLVEYNKALSALPADHSAAAISAGKVAALTKLSSVYCDVLANTPALLAEKFPGLSLAAAPADSAAFAKTLVDGLYGPETSLQGTRATDIQTVAATVDALKGFAGTGPAIFMATCAGIAASAEFFLY